MTIPINLISRSGPFPVAPLKPCPECGGEAVKEDCGYTTFNPEWVRCTTCGFRSEGGEDAWNELAKALKSVRPPAKNTRRLSDALARIIGEKGLRNLLAGKSADGTKKTRSF